LPPARQSAKDVFVDCLSLPPARIVGQPAKNPLPTALPLAGGKGFWQSAKPSFPVVFEESHWRRRRRKNLNKILCIFYFKLFSMCNLEMYYAEFF
jgi:hypothetical protein